VKSYKEYLSLGNPVLFLDFSFDCSDIEDKIYNVEKLTKKYISNSEFSSLDNIHFFDGCLLNNTTKLDEYSLVFVGLVNSYGADTDAYENFLLVEKYCKEKNIPLLCYGQPRYTSNKYKQLQVLSNNNVSIPKTYTCTGLSCNVDFVSTNYEFPVVLKPAHGSQGRGVTIVKNETELKRVAGKLKNDILLIQEFIPNDCDYRVFFIGNKTVFTVKRSSTDAGEFRNNISLGGTGKRVALGFEEMNMAKRAHDSMGFYTSGVDLVQNKDTGKWYVLEVNQAPQFSIFGPEDVIKIFVEDINMLKK
jgi:predicted ATP-grasp superfamily ATP-dependent carboligase